MNTNKQQQINKQIKQNKKNKQKQTTNQLKPNQKQNKNNFKNKKFRKTGLTPGESHIVYVTSVVKGQKHGICR